MARDDSLAQARKIGVISGSRVLRDSLGLKDKADFLTFTVTRRSSFSLNLSQLKANLNVTLLRDGRTILQSQQPKNQSESIAAILAPGTYTVRVSTKRESSRYRLKLSASPVFPAVASRLLSTSSAEIGSIDPATGSFASLASTRTAYNDIAAAPNGDLFGVSPNTLYQIDPATGTSSQVGSLGISTPIDALAFTPTNQLYAAGNSSFYSINTSTGAATLIANIPGFDISGDLAYDSTSNRFLATSKNVDAKDSLFSIGLNGGAVRLGEVGFYNVWGLAFNNTVLYGYTSNRWQIMIDPITGKATFDRAVTGTTAQIYGAS